MINCIIIDDQKEAIEVIESHLKSKIEFSLNASFIKPLEALSYLEKNEIDLVFIDIQMPQLTGIEFIETLRLKGINFMPKFIFVTGFSNYAIDGFEQGVVDFLLKPVTFKRFNIAMDRFIAQWNEKPSASSPQTDYFFVEVQGQKQKIKFADITYIESAGNYITIFKSDERLTIYQSLYSIKSILDSQNFMQVHKSYIINLNHIESVKGLDLFVKYKSETQSVPMSNTYKDQILKRLGIK
jgi:two-component system, LytTR family, response regulator